MNQSHYQSPTSKIWRFFLPLSFGKYSSCSYCSGPVSINQCVPPLCCKTCAVCPVFARAVGELRAADPRKNPRAREEKCQPKGTSEAMRRRWKLGQEQHPGPENQDSRHMLNQPRVSFPQLSYFLRLKTMPLLWPSGTPNKTKQKILPCRKCRSQ